MAHTMAHTAVHRNTHPAWRAAAGWRAAHPRMTPQRKEACMARFSGKRRRTTPPTGNGCVPRGINGIGVSRSRTVVMADLRHTAKERVLFWLSVRVSGPCGGFYRVTTRNPGYAFPGEWWKSQSVAIPFWPFCSQRPPAFFPVCLRRCGNTRPRFIQVRHPVPGFLARCGETSFNSMTMAKRIRRVKRRLTVFCAIPDIQTSF